MTSVDERDMLGQNLPDLNRGCKEDTVTLLQGDKSFGEDACLLEIHK